MTKTAEGMTDPSPSPRDAATRAGVTLRLLWPQWQGPGRLAGLHVWTEDDVPNIAGWGIASFSPDDLRATTRPATGLARRRAGRHDRRAVHRVR